MAAFTLDNETLAMLTSALNVGFDGIENTEHCGKIAALMAELEAIEARGGMVEITVVGDEIELGGNGPGNASDFFGMADGTEGDQAYAHYETTGDERLRTVM